MEFFLVFFFQKSLLGSPDSNLYKAERRIIGKNK